MYLLFWMVENILFCQFYKVMGIYVTQYFIYNYNYFAGNLKGKLPHVKCKGLLYCHFGIITLEGFLCLCSLFWFFFFYYKNGILIETVPTKQKYLFVPPKYFYTGSIPDSWKLTNVHSWNHVPLPTVVWKNGNKHLIFKPLNYYSFPQHLLSPPTSLCPCGCLPCPGHHPFWWHCCGFLLTPLCTSTLAPLVCSSVSQNAFFKNPRGDGHSPA